MLTSARTREKQRIDSMVERKKLQMSQKFADEEMEVEYCKRMLKSYEEKNDKMKKIQVEKRNQYREEEERNDDDERRREEEEDDDDDDDDERRREEVDGDDEEDDQDEGPTTTEREDSDDRF